MPCNLGQEGPSRPISPLHWSFTWIPSEKKDITRCAVNRVGVLTRLLAFEGTPMPRAGPCTHGLKRYPSCVAQGGSTVAGAGRRSSHATPLHASRTRGGCPGARTKAAKPLPLLRFSVVKLGPSPLFPRSSRSYNHTERELRTVVFGRKNHLGSKSKRGTEVAAVLYTLIESAYLNGFDSYKYLVEATCEMLEDPTAVPLPLE